MRGTFVLEFKHNFVMRTRHRWGATDLCGAAMAGVNTAIRVPCCCVGRVVQHAMRNAAALRLHGDGRRAKGLQGTMGALVH